MIYSVNSCELCEQGTQRFVQICYKSQIKFTLAVVFLEKDIEIFYEDFNKELLHPFFGHILGHITKTKSQNSNVLLPRII